MCLSKPKFTTPEVTRYQPSREPVAREASDRTSSNARKGGRRSTILASRAPVDVSVTGKKTALGA